MASLFGTAGSGRNVRIAILDTWPAPKSQKRLRNKVRRKGAALEARLAEAGVSPAQIAALMARLDRASGDGLVAESRIHADFLERYQTPGEPRCATFDQNRELDQPMKMPDHGLFIADLVKQVAPGAILSVYRVLNDWGVGDLRTVAYAIADAIEEANGEPLIINLSFGFTPPPALIKTYLEDPESALLNSEEWIRTSSEILRERSRRRQGSREWDIDALKSPASGKATLAADWSKGLLTERDGEVTLDGAIRALDLLFNRRYLPPNVLIVAAAGNDSWEGYIADPRLPALTEGVLGVSAAIPLTTQAGHPQRWQSTLYTNADDLANPDDGVTAFGGEVDYTNGGSIHAPIGLYLSDFHQPGDNVEGLAQWSGTSFAAPLAAAYAACIWAAEPDADASAVLEAIVTNPDGSPRRAIPLGYQ